MRVQNLFFIFFALGVNFVFGQTNPPQSGQRVIFPSPQSAQLGKYGNFKLNHSTGLPNVSIPLYTGIEGKVQVPVSLSYFYQGFRPSDAPSWVGLGWSLNVGGSISRVIKGTADEIISGQGPKIKTLVDGSSPTTTNYLNLATLNNNYAETEPDLFSFQFDGHSGKFIIDETGAIKTISESKMTFSFTKSGYGPDNKQVITQWSAVSEDGTRYTFNAFEVSFREDNAMYIFPSSWYLTELISPAGDKVTFEYTSKNDTKRRIQLSISESAQVSQNNNASSSRVDVNYSLEIYLQKVVGTNWELNFESSEYVSTSTHTSYSRKLDKIKVTDKTTNTTVKEFQFLYKNVSSVKLTLESVGEVGLPSHSFTYLGTTIGPSVTGNTMQVDAWGFFNGVSNTSLLSYNPGVDLWPRYSQTVNGALGTITYPTGGSTSFEYELNEYSSVGTGNTSKGKTTTITHDFYFRRIDAVGVLQHNPNTAFTLLQPTTVYIRFSGTSPSNCTAYNSLGFQQFNLAAGDYSGDKLLKMSAFSPCNQIWGNCADPLDPCGFFPPEGYDVAISVRYYVTTNVGRPDAGGLRVKKMTDTPSNPSGTSIVTTYTYNQESNSALSSGVVSFEPIYDVSFSTGSQNIRLIRSSPFNPSAFSPIYYKEVKELNSEYQTQYTFTSHSDANDIKGKWAYLFDIPETQVSEMYLTPISSLDYGEFENYDFERGLPKTITVKDLAGNLKRTTVINYQFGAVGTAKVAGFYHDFFGSYLGLSGLGVQTRNVYYGKAYYYGRGWPRKISETVTDYGSSGENPVATTNSYLYSSNHFQMTQQRLGQSDGSVLETNYKFPLDYNPATGTPLRLMINQNMLSYPLEKYTYLEKSANDRKLVDANITTYTSITGTSNRTPIYLPFKQFKMNLFDGTLSGQIAYNGVDDPLSSTGYEEESRVANYDARGNPLSILLKGSEKISYVWGYNGQHPVAEIQNADYAAVNSALTSAGTTYAAMSASVSSTDIRSKIDAISTSLTSALVTGYTYKPLIGMESVTDPSGKRTFYVYDGLERLSEIRENFVDGPLLKSYHYKYISSGSVGTSITTTPTVTAPSDPTLSGSTASCNFNISASASSGSPTTSQSLQLTYTCSGTDCSGITYAWSGNGVSGSSSPLNITASSTAGTYTYTVSASKSGCTTKTADVVLTVTAPNSSICYTFAMAGNGKYLSNHNGVPKLKVSDGSASQIWEASSQGSGYFKITAKGSSTTAGIGNVLGVAGQGSSVDNVVDLQTNTTGDHQLWDMSAMSGADLGRYILVRKNTSLRIGSRFNWGEGDLSNPESDFSLGSDPENIYGLYKWVRTQVGCPGATCDFNISLAASVSSPVTGQQITLTSSCAGANCSGLTYSWAGQGVSGTASSATFNAPATAGSYSYTVTVNRSGCAAKTATVTINVTAASSSTCYTFTLASNGKILSNHNGVPKVKNSDGSASQIWEASSQGSGYYKIVSKGGTTTSGVGNVLGVAGQGSSVDNAVDLQSSTTGDHQLWDMSALTGADAGRYIFVRKGTSLRIGSRFNWGDGDLSNPASDFALGSDPDNVYGLYKWTRTQVGCPGSTCDFNMSLTSNVSNPVTGQQITLSSSCSGGNCSGLTYSWTGQGVSGTTSTVTFNVPSTAGSYTYTVTVSQSGCTSKTASLTLTVTGTCYTFTLASNGKLLSNHNGVPKVKNSDGTASQIWEASSQGSGYYKIVSKGSTTTSGIGSVLGVAGQGSSVDNAVDLQGSTTGDHQLWNMTAMTGSDAGRYIFVRKGTSLRIGSRFNWGDGDLSNPASDFALGSDPDNVYGLYKWTRTQVGCPN